MKVFEYSDLSLEGLLNLLVMNAEGKYYGNATLSQRLENEAVTNEIKAEILKRWWTKDDLICEVCRRKIEGKGNRYYYHNRLGVNVHANCWGNATNVKGEDIRMHAVSFKTID